MTFQNSICIIFSLFYGHIFIYIYLYLVRCNIHVVHYIESKRKLKNNVSENIEPLYSYINKDILKISTDYTVQYMI
jgi:hypothetical protein